MSPKPNSRRETFFMLMLCFLFLTLEGCSTVSIVANQSPPADDIIHKTEFALWWGFADPIESVECGGAGLHFVKAKTNWLYSLCTVVTLGAVVPLEVEYRCALPAMPNGGTIGEAERIDP